MYNSVSEIEWLCPGDAVAETKETKKATHSMTSRSRARVACYALKYLRMNLVSSSSNIAKYINSLVKQVLRRCEIKSGIRTISILFGEVRK